MALVRRLESKPCDRYAVHGETTGAYRTFEHAGQVYLQINTFGSQFRRDRSHPSQTIQFGPEALAQLQDILKREVFGAHPDPAPTKTSGRIGILKWR
jgi:hypothetical protein